MTPRGQMHIRHYFGALTSDWAPVVETTDIDEATEVIRPAFFPIDIAPRNSESVQIRVKAEELPLLSIGYLHMCGGAVMRIADVPGYHIAVAVPGHTVTKWSDRRASTVTALGSATVFEPGTDVELLWSPDCAQLGIKIGATEVARELKRLLDRSVRKPIEFAQLLDLAATTSQSWLNLIEVLAREAGRDDGLLRHPLATANLQHHVRIK